MVGTENMFIFYILFRICITRWCHFTERILGIILIQLMSTSINKCIEFKLLEKIWFIIIYHNDGSTIKATDAQGQKTQLIIKSNQVGI